ncbi:anthranilate 1,2-dioxygenase electron transfer component AntC [Pseudomonas sp. dw_358]|uniref:anthranilate 1,2-dioxygenase electron transfer component AntC n=1 Tax=Pseudomonas sp. dw_358 TaxID=2720083 RepID=UPI001BD3A46E|nr:anthranilate 1,2-dioxygenase electron transfer component AntC [Pseudomonas sp. dw_358]
MTYKAALSFADGKTLFCTVQKNERLLDAALRSGITLPLDCREGVCATCQGRCESGLYTQDYVDDEALSAADLARHKVLSCQTRLLSDAAFYFDYDSTLCSKAEPGRHRARVTALERPSARTAILHVKLDGEAILDYLPGQYARLHIPGTEQSRAYSFANASGTGTLQFLVRLLSDGVMSDYLRERCEVGDLIEFEAPLGTFYLRHVERPLVMVAGGTGLSAFLGMLDELAEQGGCGHPVRLYHGVRDVADLCELARIEDYARRITDFTFVPVISQPGAAWAGRRGYIADHLDQAAVGERPFDLYVCGPPPMVESIKAWREAQAAQDARLYFEKFIESHA